MKVGVSSLILLEEQFSTQQRIRTRSTFRHHRSDGANTVRGFHIQAGQLSITDNWPEKEGQEQ